MDKVTEMQHYVFNYHLLSIFERNYLQETSIILQCKTNCPLKKNLKSNNQYDKFILTGPGCTKID